MGIILTIFLLLTCVAYSFGQAVPQESASGKEEQKRPVTLSLLNNYYDQEGAHGAVDGGQGSQDLESFTQEAHIYIPKHTLSGMKINTGIDHFTSESLRFIDKYKTSASAAQGNVSGDETRYFGSFGYDFGNRLRKTITSVGVGYSEEYDVKSYSLNLGWSKELPKQNLVYQFGLGIVADRWLMVYPGEFRNQVLINAEEGGNSGGTSGGGNSGGGNSGGHSGDDDDDDDDHGSSGHRPAGGILLSGSTGASGTDSTYNQVPAGYATPIPVTGKTGMKDGKSYPIDWRYSVNMTNKLNFVINQRMNGSLGLDLTYQAGLLSTPFYRVYFNDGITNELDKEVRIEKLPRKRLRAALYGRYNYHVLSNLVLRTQARWYMDNWGISGLTAQIELPVKISSAFSVMPYYRFSTQKGTGYFAPYAAHVYTPGSYYTSDYDLSSFSSHKVGGAIRLSPLKPITGIRDEQNTDYVFSLASASFRYGYYQRSDGFHASSYSLELNFNF
ncbi:DUF3570 domain-containing protein [Edaphocola aurantiacus]|uniref:DUF3570 domain-containing protein n=1 Tax=Edaphocola aurantiacus TaxID=2601682 RepID=UPI001C966C60|nr:DUF3570 domain-containing protein [Edaphocola aurantiacus]